MKQKFVYILILCTMIGWLGACGQAGKLYLPKQTAHSTEKI